MANIKITDLPELSETPNDANLLEIVDKASETPTSKKITWANIKAAVLTAVGKVNEAVGFTLSGGTTSKTLTVEDTSVVNQDLTTDASPTFANITDSGLTALQMVYTDADKKLVSKPFATAAEITTGTEAAKAIAPDQLALSKYNVGYATAAEITAGTEAAKAIAPDQLKLSGLTAQLQSVSATVESNALTMGLNPCVLDFRSATLANGVPITRAVSATLSLVIPSGATLGAINGQAARLILLAIDNAGTPELAVVNLSGGNNLDETTLISTTAINSDSDAANVIYSLTARSNVAFRVVGFANVTEAAAGTWASAPTLVQGCGGQALAALSSLGYGQTWQSLTGSRAFSTTYYNTTGKPILVFVSIRNASEILTETLTVNGVVAASSLGPGVSSGQIVSGIIPPGASYSITVTGGTPTLLQWSELR